MVDSVIFNETFENTDLGLTDWYNANGVTTPYFVHDEELDKQVIYVRHRPGYPSPGDLGMPVSAANDTRTGVGFNKFIGTMGTRTKEVTVYMIWKTTNVINTERKSFGSCHMWRFLSDRPSRVPSEVFTGNYTTAHPQLLVEPGRQGQQEYQHGGILVNAPGNYFLSTTMNGSGAYTIINTNLNNTLQDGTWYETVIHLNLKANNNLGRARMKIRPFTRNKSATWVEYFDESRYAIVPTSAEGFIDAIHIGSYMHGGVDIETQFYYGQVKVFQGDTYNQSDFSDPSTPEPKEVSLNDLTDVTLTAPEESQVLMYRGGKWVNVDARPLVAQLVEDILNETSLVVNKPST